ncbi:MAG: hypothetical protein DSZ05_08760 [Sulfurospirillum sp.]|nr:MAG: hypothetical protein DSZ05_08760 [Sulfurospirillum sp.]
MNGLLLASSHENKDIKFTPKNILDTKDDLTQTKHDFFQNLMENLLHDIPKSKNRDFLIAQVLDLPENIAKNETIRSSFAKEPLFKEHQIDKVSVESLLELVALLRQHPNEPLTAFPTDSQTLKTALLDLDVQQEFREAKTIGDLLHLAKKHHIKVKNITFFKEEAALDPKTKQMIKAVKSEEIFKLITEEKQTLHTVKEARSSDILKTLLINQKNDLHETKSVQTKTILHQNRSISKTDTILSNEKNDFSTKSHPKEHFKSQIQPPTTETKQLNTSIKTIDNAKEDDSGLQNYQKEKSPTNSDKISQKEHFNTHTQPSSKDTKNVTVPTKTIDNIKENVTLPTQKTDHREKLQTTSDKIILKENDSVHVEKSKTGTEKKPSPTSNIKSEKAVTPPQTLPDQNTQKIAVHKRATQPHIDKSPLQHTLQNHNIKEVLEVNNNSLKSNTPHKKEKDLTAKEHMKIQNRQTPTLVLDKNEDTAPQQIKISGTTTTSENIKRGITVTTSEPSRNHRDSEYITSISEETESLHEDQTPVSHETKTTPVQQIKIKHTELKHTLNTFAQDFKEQVENYKAPLMKIKMQLNPGNLGDVDVTLINRGNNLHVTINSNPSAIAIFTQNQTEFKNALVNMGFTGLQMSFGESKEQGRGQNHKQTGKQSEKASQEIHETDHFEMIVPRYV